MAEHAIASLGAVRLKSLTARHVRSALEELAPSLSTRSLRLVHQVLERSITHAQAADLVARNVAALVAVPKGRVGRPSKSLTLEQATRVLSAAETTPLSAYVSLSLLSGLPTEELRSLLWADVDLDTGTLAVYLSVRATGDTKTPRPAIEHFVEIPSAGMLQVLSRVAALVADMTLANLTLTNVARPMRSSRRPLIGLEDRGCAQRAPRRNQGNATSCHRVAASMLV